MHKEASKLTSKDTDFQPTWLIRPLPRLQFVRELKRSHTTSSNSSWRFVVVVICTTDCQVKGYSTYYTPNKEIVIGRCGICECMHSKMLHLLMCSCNNWCNLSVADPGKRKGGCQSIQREVRAVRPTQSAENVGVTPTSGALKLGKIPLSARGSPILDFRRTATNSQLASLG